ncbi:MAG: hypothetical protein KKB50_21600 [Planctomycetes bacterium]|nr:hypothetical protein [Planctomycetota bacterium]
MLRAATVQMSGLVAGLALLVGAAVADLANVHLKGGTKLRGDVTVTETEVILRNAAGEVRFEKSAVERIEWLGGAAAAGDPEQAEPQLPVSVDAEYLQRFKAEAADDIKAHFALAEWLREKKRFDLLVKQCNYILGLDPQHRNARLLLQLAREELAQQTTAGAGTRTEAAGAAAASGQLAAPALLSELDVQRLKMYEYPLDGDAERLLVRFPRRAGQPDLDSLVLHDLALLEDRAADLRERYTQAKPHEKLPIIIDATGVKYADRIQIAGDSEKFTAFRKQVLPLVYKSCARSGCHGGSTAVVFRLPARSQRDEAVYTAFLLLDRVQTEFGPLLDREDPAASALLGYMLPAADSQRPHPPVGQGKRVMPLAKNTRDRSYLTVLDWINALNVPHPEYELDYKYPGWLPAPPTPTTGPASAEGAAPQGEEQAAAGGEAAQEQQKEKEPAAPDDEAP